MLVACSTGQQWAIHADKECLGFYIQGQKNKCALEKPNLQLHCKVKLRLKSKAENLKEKKLKNKCLIFHY